VLVENHKLDGVISMPSGVFKPYAGVSTAILMFTKTGAGGTDKVWFYDMEADGFSLDDKRQEIESNDIPDIIQSWHNYCGARLTSSVNSDQLSLFDGSQTVTNSSQKWFLVAKDTIVKNGYDLSINRYKEVDYEEVSYELPTVILAKLKGLEAEINQDLTILEGLLR
jgi:type I restriction enzyme M protein